MEYGLSPRSRTCAHRTPRSAHTNNRPRPLHRARHILPRQTTNVNRRTFSPPAATVVIQIFIYAAPRRADTSMATPDACKPAVRGWLRAHLPSLVHPRA